MAVNKKEIARISKQIKDEIGISEFEEIKIIIEANDFYYHVSPIENKSNIENCGLLTKRKPLTKYHETDKLKRAQVCFTAQIELLKTVDNIKFSKECKDVCIYQISAKLLSKLDIGLDWTHGNTIDIYDETNKIQSIRRSINLCGVIACFENINRDDLKLYSEKELYNIIK